MGTQKRPPVGRPRQHFTRFLDLPAEIRCMVYTFACNPNASTSDDVYERCNTIALFKNKVVQRRLRRQLQVPAVAQASKQLRQEAMHVHYGSNVFAIKSFRSLRTDMVEHHFGFKRIRFFVLERYLVFSSSPSRNQASPLVCLNGVLLRSVFEISPDRTRLTIKMRFPDSSLFRRWNAKVEKLLSETAAEVCVEVRARNKKIELEDLLRFDSLISGAIGDGYNLLTVNYVPRSGRVCRKVGYNYHMLRTTWEILVDECVKKFRESGF